MSRKVIFVHNNPLVERLRRGFLIDEMMAHGFEVEYWEVQNLVRHEYQRVQFPDAQKDSFIRKFNNLEEFNKALQQENLAQTIFVVQVWERWMSRKMYFSLVQHGCYLVRLNIYSIIKYSKVIDRFSRIGDVLKIFRFKGEDELKVLVYKSWKLLKGYRTFGHLFSVSPPRTHAINRADYDVYQRVQKETTPVVEGPFVLFIDMYFPLHSESAFHSNRVNEIAAQYQQSMNRYFDWLEKTHGAPVVIAAHPSSDYKTEWGSRKVIKYKTAELARDAEKIILHASTSNVYAVMSDKPVAYLVTDAMYDFHFGRFAHATSRDAGYFEKKPFNVDRVNFESVDFSVYQPQLRKKYLYEHVTSPESENRTNADIVLEEFDRIFDELLRGNWPECPIIKS